MLLFGVICWLTLELCENPGMFGLALIPFSGDESCEGVLMIHKLYCKYIILWLIGFKTALHIRD